MTDIRTSFLGGTPFGTSATRPANPEIGQTYFNGTLGVQEIYTSSGWLPATGANDFNVTLNGSVTTATFTKEYFSGAYTIASALLDNTYDIYVYDTSGAQVGYTKSPSLNATGNFNKIVVIGGSQGDLLSFSYKTTFIASSTTSQVTAGAFINSITPTSLPSLNDTATVSGGNFASNVLVYFMGSDNVEIPAKSIVRSSDSQLIVTRPDSFPTNLGTYKVVVENPGINRPTGSSLHILNNAVSAGSTPNWTTNATLTTVLTGSAYSASLLASDETAVTYSYISGSLPTGLSFNAGSGLISGTVGYSLHFGSSQNYTYTVRATDTGGNYVDRTFTIPVAGYTSQANPAASGYALSQAVPTAPSGWYYIKSASMTNALSMYVDMTEDGGGYDFYFITSGPSVSYVTDSNGGTSLGLDLVMPRSKYHWRAMENAVANVKPSGSNTDYFATCYGIYRNNGGSVSYTNQIMRSPSYYSSGAADWKVKDGGRWWLRDSTYGEPNGDYSSNGFLSGSYGYGIGDRTFNDGGTYATGNYYLVSTNAKP